MNIHIEFCGGLELIIHGEQKSVDIVLEGSNVTLKDVVEYIKNNLIKERVELFAQGDSVRPGVLVLVNEVDWELLDGVNSPMSDKDSVVFISTLHGG